MFVFMWKIVKVYYMNLPGWIEGLEKWYSLAQQYEEKQKRSKLPLTIASPVSYLGINFSMNEHIDSIASSICPDKIILSLKSTYYRKLAIYGRPSKIVALER